MSDLTAAPDDFDVEAVLRELAEATHRLPEQALRTIQAHRELFIPRLIQSLDAAAEKVVHGEPLEANDQFFAAFLLVEFRAKQALPAFIKMFRTPEDSVFELLGDGVHELVAPALATLAADKLDLIDELILSDELNFYVRWGAAGAYRILVKEGELTRKEGLDRLHGLLKKAIEQRQDRAVSVIVAELYHFVPREALDDIRRAYELDLVEEGIIDLEEFEDQSDDIDCEFQKELAHSTLTYNYDTVELLRSWHSMSGESSEDPEDDEDFDDDDFLEDAPALKNLSLVAPEVPADPPSTVRFVGERVGRNDPCPCGSGRKFKKCCGAR